MKTSAPPKKTELIVKFKHPHIQQLPFIRDKIKRKVVRAGRRGGKTSGAAILAGENFLKGRRILYAAPTIDQVGKFWAEIKVAFAHPLEAGVLYKNESSHVIEAPGTEARIKAKTAWNADSLRGDYADLLILDEWQLMNEDAWELVGVPMLLDNDGDAVFIYTPPSLASRSVTKARDPRHAAKLFQKAKLDRSGRWKAYHFSSHSNPHISRRALEEISKDMSSLAYRQEINAEDVDEAPGALWKNETIEKNRVFEVLDLERIVVGVDPSANQGERHLDEAGIIVAGRKGREGYALADRTRRGSPKEWADEVVRCYQTCWRCGQPRLECICQVPLTPDYVVAEKNNGGEMVRHTIHSVDESVPVILVHASRGKYVRAEPVSVRAERGEIHHVGQLPMLEDELTMWVPGNASPNRLDAYVWAFTDLLIGSGTLEMHVGGESQGEPATVLRGSQEVDESLDDVLKKDGLYFPER